MNLLLDNIKSVHQVKYFFTTLVVFIKRITYELYKPIC